jgi:type VI secretion system protein ImpM
MSTRQVAVAPSPTGLFGKVPDLGDFVTRRLPAEFVTPWDRWLEEGIAESRARLGAIWEERYQNAPAWRFILSPGTCGDGAWGGILQPSVDRVGRYFPLTLAAGLPPDIDVLETLIAANGWYDRLEHVAAASLDGAMEFPILDRRVEDLSFPFDRLIPADAGDDTLPIAERAVTALKISAGRTRPFDHAREALRRAQVVVGPWHCVWYDASPHALDRVLLVTKTLPAPRLFCAMLDGRWAAHGWETGNVGAEQQAG